MTTAREWLDAAQALSDAATDGPWVCDHMNVIGTRAGWWSPIRYDAHRVDQDADFIAAVRSDVPVMVAALRAVLDLCDVDDRMFAESWDVEAVIRWSPEVRRRIDAALGTVTP